jgi:hypothetical protein
MNADGTLAIGTGERGATADRSAVGDRVTGLDDPRAIQILATKHWSLLATRTLSWNESFSRTSMLLAALSATAVALALAAQVADFGPAFLAFALVTLPVVELIGLATFARLGEAHGEDLLAIQGMNRIRNAYVQIAPMLEPYFVAGRNDDLAALFSTYGMGADSTSSLQGDLHHAFVMTQGLVGIINVAVGGVFGALLASFVGASTAEAVVAGVILLVVVLRLQIALGRSIGRRWRCRLTVHFPSVPARLRGAGNDGAVEPSSVSSAAQSIAASQARSSGLSVVPPSKPAIGDRPPR